MVLSASKTNVSQALRSHVPIREQKCGYCCPPTPMAAFCANCAACMISPTLLVVFESRDARVRQKEDKMVCE